MARERTNRQPAAPGRTPRRTRSTRTTSRPATATADKSQARTEGVEPQASGRNGRLSNVTFTRRALVLVGVLAVLGLSYANSLRIMLNQQRDLATANAQIASRSAQLADLDAQLQRWRDPAYVKSQARSQLGWVMPGEVGYRVIGMDGKVIEDPANSAAITTGGGALQTHWWDRLSVSAAAADLPTDKP